MIDVATASVERELERYFAASRLRAGDYGPHYVELWDQLEQASAGGKRARPRWCWRPTTGSAAPTRPPRRSSPCLRAAAHRPHRPRRRHRPRPRAPRLAQRLGAFAARGAALGADDRRRSTWGEAAALLAGDLALSQAHRIVAQLDIDARHARPPARHPRRGRLRLGGRRADRRRRTPSRRTCSASPTCSRRSSRRRPCTPSRRRCRPAPCWPAHRQPTSPALGRFGRDHRHRLPDRRRPARRVRRRGGDRQDHHRRPARGQAHRPDRPRPHHDRTGRASPPSSARPTSTRPRPPSCARC